MSGKQRVQDITIKSRNYYHREIANNLSKLIIKKTIRNYVGLQPDNHNDDDNYDDDNYDDDNYGDDNYDDWDDPPKEDDTEKDYSEGFCNASKQFTFFLQRLVEHSENDSNILVHLDMNSPVDISKMELVDEWFAEFLKDHKTEIVRKFETLTKFTRKAIKKHYIENKKNISHVAMDIDETLGEWLQKEERKMLKQKIKKFKKSMVNFETFVSDPQNTIASIKQALNDLILWTDDVENWKLLSKENNRKDKDGKLIYEPEDGNYESLVSNHELTNYGGHFEELGDCAEELLGLS